jgi:predicted DNA-binding helix-hairpin-helix protein
MEFQDKLELLGGFAAQDISCQTCAANPRASIITHRANQPLSTNSPLPLQEGQGVRDLQPWLATAIRSDGKRIPIIKTLMTSACEKDCYYCATRRGRNSARRETFKPDELAAGFHIIHQRGFAEGLFLSSGVIGGGTRTMEKTIAAVDLLRRKYEFRGYVHLKLMPGAERAAIERAVQLADRVSVNLEAPNSERLQKLSGTKQFTQELLAPLRAARELMRQHPELARTSMVTQFVVGAADETDREIMATTTRLYRELALARVYYSAFHPVRETPLENHAPTNPLRERRLYQADFLLRQYGFAFDELAFDAENNLPLDMDPKTMWALAHPETFPLDVQRATREELLRVPGLGPTSVERVLKLRHSHTFTTIQELQRLGADAERAAPFILLNGKQPPQQLVLFRV